MLLRSLFTIPQTNGRQVSAGFRRSNVSLRLWFCCLQRGSYPLGSCALRGCLKNTEGWEDLWVLRVPYVCLTYLVGLQIGEDLHQDP